MFLFRLFIWLMCSSLLFSVAATMKTRIFSQIYSTYIVRSLWPGKKKYHSSPAPHPIHRAWHSNLTAYKERQRKKIRWKNERKAERKQQFTDQLQASASSNKKFYLKCLLILFSVPNTIHSIIWICGFLISQDRFFFHLIYLFHFCSAIFISFILIK